MRRVTIWDRFIDTREIVEYLNHKSDTGLLQVKTVDLVADGIPRLIYEVIWGAYRAVVQPEFERLCDDYDFTPETWYAAQGSDVWSKIARKDFTPEGFMKVQVLLHERRKG